MFVKLLKINDSQLSSQKLSNAQYEAVIDEIDKLSTCLEVYHPSQPLIN